MNIFVLSTGRCGSETFARACQHATNYTVAHESNSPNLNPDVEHPYGSLRFPDQHIEVDNRLSWLLGTLDKNYGQDAYYVHLLRRREEVARSYAVRGEESILFAYAWGVLQHFRKARQFSEQDRFRIGLQFWDTVNDNIALFLRDKPRRITMWLHEIEEPFTRFWQEIGATGSFSSALVEWTIRHNASRPVPLDWSSQDRELLAVHQQLERLIPTGADFILVDDAQENGHAILPGRTRVPFLERSGAYWGPPADDEVAISELTRLRAAGVQFIAFSHPALWWLKHYSGFSAHLGTQFYRAADTPWLVAFNLNRSTTGKAID